MSDSLSYRPPEEEDLLGRLADEYMTRRQRGEEPTVEEYVARHPELAEAIEELLATLDLLEGRGGTDPADPAEAAEAATPRRIGDFEIVREAGRGGMGIVYEARQRTLDRRVALKLLPPQAVIDPLFLKRFQREAQAAARLQHPHIVAVHEVGEADGVHYIAMQYVDGHSLSEVLDGIRMQQGGDVVEAADTLSVSLGRTLLEQPLEDLHAGSGDETKVPTEDAASRSSVLSATADLRYVRNVAQLGEQVARALAYAHLEGVLHRDLKPSNLLVGSDGHVWITDFGLAKAEGDDQLTASGDVLGTPRYMAPESLEGWSDPRTDVYGIGATLYEMLTLRPPFDGASRVEVLRRVRDEEPTRLRRLNPRIPRDLETIVRTAMEKDPQRRYGSAGELADDLDRYLRDQPIQARPATTVYRARLFVRRHPWAVGLTSLLLVTLMSLGVGWMVSLQRALNASEENFRFALSAVDEMLADVEAEVLLHEGELEPLREKVLRKALGFYQQFLSSREQDTGVRFESAALWIRLANLHKDLAEFDQAASALSRAEDLLEGTVIRSQRDLNMLVRFLLVRGSLCRDLGEFDEARAAYEEAVASCEDWRKSADDDASQAVQLRAVGQYGKFLASSQSLVEALPVLDEGIELGRQLVSRRDEAPRWRSLRNLLAARADVRSRLGNVGGSARDREEEIDILNRLVRSSEAVPYDRLWLANATSLLGSIRESQGRAAEALESKQRALQLATALQEDFPGVARYQLARARIQKIWGVSLRKRGRLTEARDCLEPAVALLEGLDSAAARFERADVLSSLGLVLTRVGEPPDATRRYREGIEILESLLEDEPDHVPYLNRLQLLRGNLGAHLRNRTSAIAEAEVEYAESIAILRRLFAIEPHTREWKTSLTVRLVNLSKIYRDTARVPESLKALEEARGLLEMILEDFPDDLGARYYLVIVHRGFGGLWTADRPDLAEPEMRSASRVAFELVELSPENPRYLSLAGACEHNLGSLLMEEDAEKALELADSAIDLQTRALEKSPRHTTYRKYLSNHYELKSNCMLILGRLGEAAEAAQRIPDAAGPRGRDHVRGAYLLADCALRAHQAGNAAETEEYLRVSIALLEAAVEQGFDDLSELLEPPYAELYEGRPRFDALQERIDASR